MLVTTWVWFLLSLGTALAGMINFPPHILLFLQIYHAPLPGWSWMIYRPN
jgi:hypothetical protein